MTDVRIEPWQPQDLPLLQRLLGDPRMTEHLGGPESPARIRDRHRRYLYDGDAAFRVVDAEREEPVGWVGYWDDEHGGGEVVHETGWSIVPEHQGRGLASAAMILLIAAMRAEARRRHVHAYPAAANPASNALCARLGFELLGEIALAYPKGTAPRPHHDWRLEL